jgi:hypothetical protein
MVSTGFPYHLGEELNGGADEPQLGYDDSPE